MGSQRGLRAVQCYLRAAQLLNVSIADCVAIEDSPNGLASAVAAGAETIVVPNDAELPAADGWHVWPTLQGRTVVDLRSLVATGSRS